MSAWLLNPYSKPVPYEWQVVRAVQERIQFLRNSGEWTGIVRLSWESRDLIVIHHLWFKMDSEKVFGDGFRIDNSMHAGEVEIYAIGSIGDPAESVALSA